jgi:hypothetical protein
MEMFRMPSAGGPTHSICVGVVLAASSLLAARTVTGQEVQLMHSADTSSAPLAETMNFIRSFLADRTTIGTASVKVTGCTIEWMQKDPRVNRQVEQNLSDMDPLTVKLDSVKQAWEADDSIRYVIKVEATAARRAIRVRDAVWHGSNPTLQKVDSISALTYPMKSRDDALRLAHALQVGVRQCGGKVSPY